MAISAKVFGVFSCPDMQNPSTQRDKAIFTRQNRFWGVCFFLAKLKTPQTNILTFFGKVKTPLQTLEGSCPLKKKNCYIDIQSWVCLFGGRLKVRRSRNRFFWSQFRHDICSNFHLKVKTILFVESQLLVPLKVALFL